MENASKALLIAAGIIISLLIITSLVLFYNQISSYYAEKHNMTQAEQLEQFNSVYQNYNDKEIRGNELISVMNRVIDYNNLQSDMKDYPRIVINVDLKGHAVDLTSLEGEELSEEEKLFDDLITNTTNDNAIKKVAELPIELVTSSEINGITDLKLQKLSAEISNIVIDETDNEQKQNRARKLKLILGYEPTDDEISDIVEATKKYDQLTQFKRTMFECYEVSFDAETGRVNGMQFEVVEDEDGKLVQD